MYSYDHKKKMRVKCGASHSGLDAALDEELSDGTWASIAFASLLLNVQEKNKSTLP